MAEMPLAEHNNMVKTIPSDRTDEPLRCKLRAMTANSAPPNGWRSATSPAEMNITDPIYADEDSYFARANPFSRTPSAFAAFQATTVALRRKLSRHLRQVGGGRS